MTDRKTAQIASLHSAQPEAFSRQDAERLIVDVPPIEASEMALNLLRLYRRDGGLWNPRMQEYNRRRLEVAGLLIDRILKESGFRGIA